MMTATDSKAIIKALIHMYIANAKEAQNETNINEGLDAMNFFENLLLLKAQSDEQTSTRLEN